ncbi:unnamed protein product, partial [Mesorhabditis belari]|uniref:Uncharacterized protein n=1 Tax=Mesorhabditis belari TaxID=2138241 RepID=A0AAF3FPR3_9BILA
MIRGHHQVGMRQEVINMRYNGERMCNCDSGEDGVDVGWNPFLNFFPVTVFYLGGTSSTSANNVSIGPLIYRNKSGQLIGEIVNGGETVTLSTKEAFNDGKWHSIYWEADSLGMRLSVDGSTVHYKGLILLPNVHQWTFGSREGKGLTGFAGVLRNIYLCGEEIVLGNSARKAPVKGVEIGEGGSCQPGFCHNGGLCVDGFDSHRCDCSLTPFGGHDCTKEYGMWVPLNSSLEIPWQNPNQQDLCHRMAIQTASSNISLIHGRSLFSAARFNLSMSGKGHLSVIGWDGFMFTHRKSDRSVVVNDERLHDITLCANKSGLKMSVDGLPLITLDGNWTFFETLNVWEILDKNFTGCVSRLRVGNSFPLKNAKASRLKHTGNIRFGTCPVNSLEVSQEEPTSTPFDEISISSVVRSRAAVISLTSIGGACLGGVLLLTLCVLVCWMRSRPEGVYKTNEGVEQYSGSGSRSEEPLVQSTLSNKEYFC